MFEYLLNNLNQLLFAALRNDSQIILFCILIVSSIIVLEAFTKIAGIKRKNTGLSVKNVSHVFPNKSFLKVQDLIVPEIHLAGKPDALLIENGFIIPVEFKALSNKVRDRYIIQLTAYMKLIEHVYKKKPPYGYLILGKNFRQVKIFNTEDKQQKLSNLVNEMVRIKENKKIAQAAPTKQKCASCSSKGNCRFKN